MTEIAEKRLCITAYFLESIIIRIKRFVKLHGFTAVASYDALRAVERNPPKQLPCNALASQGTLLAFIHPHGFAWRKAKQWGCFLRRRVKVQT